jgi:DNA helicase-2/ATP-dependent DNA helicase PcrA
MTRTFYLDSGGSLPPHLDLEHDLNEHQRAAVLAGDGPKLVIAGAGSGKTRTITYRVAYLMARGVPGGSIMLATFTNKAAREMLSRVDALMGATVGKVWGGTFHAIGNRLLRQYAPLIGLHNNYSILDVEDQRDLVKVCISETKVKTEEKRFPAPSLVQDIISFAFNTQQTIEAVVRNRYPHFIEWVGELQQIDGRYLEKKRKANAMDYDDLLREWLRLMAEQPELAQRLGRQFRAILVDEYQDTNAIQAQIVETLAAHNGRNLMVVGDDSQSIYAFRGANYDNILKFPERNPGTEVFKLEINYRSTPEILEFTNRSIAHNVNQFRKELRSTRPAGARPVVVPLNDVYQEAAFVAQRILQLRDEGVALKDIAVLYRAHAHSTILQAELVRRGVPYEIRSGVRFFEQAHIKDVIAYLKIFENPFDEVAWRRLLLMIPRIGNVTAQRLWELLVQGGDPLAALLSPQALSWVSATAKPFFAQFQHDIRTLKDGMDKERPDAMVLAVLETGYTEYLKAKYEAAQARMEDIQQLAVFAKTYRNLQAMLSELILLGELWGQDMAASRSGDGEKLILSSVHQAKGLEWHTVFIMRMNENDFPSPMAMREADGEEEERRIFYVAATRARDELIITHPLIDMGPRATGLLLQPSRFLQELPFTCYEQGVIEEAPRGYGAGGGSGYGAGRDTRGFSRGHGPTRDDIPYDAPAPDDDSRRRNDGRYDGYGSSSERFPRY